MERYYSLKQTAPLLGIKIRTVREWVKKGQLKAVKMQGSRLWVVPESEILKLQGAKNDENEN